MILPLRLSISDSQYSEEALVNQRTVPESRFTPCVLEWETYKKVTQKKNNSPVNKSVHMQIHTITIKHTYSII